MTSHLVFVYGTLRRGSVSEMSVRFSSAEFVAEAKVRGRLYDLGDYPGLLLNEGNSLVFGDVYEVDDETLKQLDGFEASSNYWRQPVEVFVGADQKAAWIYAPDPESDSRRTLIASGDWIEYAKGKAD